MVKLVNHYKRFASRQYRKIVSIKMLDPADLPTEISDAGLKKQLTTNLVEFCAKDMRPFEIVTGKGFRGFVQQVWSLGALHGNRDITTVLPHPTTISRNVKSVKEERRLQIVPEIENAIENMECSATTDMWTESHKNKHFMTMTTHYFDKNVKLKRKVLFTTEFKAKKKTGRNIRGELKRRFKNMGFDPRSLVKMRFVTDQGSNIVKGLKRPYKRDNCRAHLLNTILRNTFESDDIPLIVIKTVICCKKIVRYFKQSGKMNELSKCLIQDCGTRWNYKLDMIQSVVDRYSEIIPLLTPDRRDKWSIDLELANEIIFFLKPFKEACKSMEGDTYPTANKILLWWAELPEHLNVNNFDRIAMKYTAEVGKNFFLKKYTINMHNKIACFLDPRYRSLQMLNDKDRDEVYDKVKLLIKSEENVALKNSVPNQSSRYSHFEGSSEDNALNEFELYIRSAEYSSYLKDDTKHLVESFWRDNQNKFPNLFKLMKKRLHVPASSGSSERVFSDAGRMYDPRRTNIKPQVLDDLLFMRDHLTE